MPTVLTLLLVNRNNIAAASIAQGLAHGDPLFRKCAGSGSWHGNVRNTFLILIMARGQLSSDCPLLTHSSPKPLFSFLSQLSNCSRERRRKRRQCGGEKEEREEGREEGRKEGRRDGMRS